MKLTAVDIAFCNCGGQFRTVAENEMHIAVDGDSFAHRDFAGDHIPSVRQFGRVFRDFGTERKRLEFFFTVFVEIFYKFRNSAVTADAVTDDFMRTFCDTNK